jgi:tRNA 2-selenouridine synthase
MSVEKIGPDKFLKYCGTIPVVDTRTPSEFLLGHVPGAVNIPLFSDEERAAVGLTYKRKGRSESVSEGLRYAGPTLWSKLQEAQRLATSDKLMVYCWRGGLRSESMAWLFSIGGLKVWRLDGGYKAYRNSIIDKLAIRRKTLILGGLTGSGKTSILNTLEKREEQVVDLEALAHHRGSAFGALGQSSQPSTEYFANILFEAWKVLDYNKTIWLEDESRNIGSVFLPDQFWRNMQESVVIALISKPSVRLPRLIREYSVFPTEQLRESVLKISKRLGGVRAREALLAIDAGDFEKAAAIALEYYDKAYLYSLSHHPSYLVHRLETKTDDPEENADLVIALARKKGLL